MFEEANNLDDEADFYDNLATRVALDKEDDSKRKAEELVGKTNCYMCICDGMHVVCSLTTTICIITAELTSRGEKKSNK